MTRSCELLTDIEYIFQACRQSHDGQRCAVAPHPELRKKIIEELKNLRANEGSALRALARFGEPRRLGLNDGMIIPPEEFPLGTPIDAIRAVGAQRAPLRGVVRVVVVLVDFDDQHMAQPAAHFQDLFFSIGVIPTKSVREYYQEVTHGLIDIQGVVAGPFRLPQTLATYAHGASGIGAATPNAATMARDAVLASDPTVNFAPFDNDGNGFVDAFIVVHAGPGAEETGSPSHIWSHKWVLDGGSQNVDGTKIFAYLTVPEDAKIGVCCHELGHLLFGFPDLYDTDGSSEGIGNWCLMAGGSWGGGGDTPVHPSAWCKTNQGWAAVDIRTSNSTLNIPDVKDSHVVYRLWKDGAPGSEYFLLENRQLNRFDVSLPEGGLLIWHIDESISTNTDENHYKVALMQADGQRDLELAQNRGDKGDPYPGSANNTAFSDSSNPNSKSYAGQSTCVAVSGISAPGAVMSANVRVSCKLVEKRRLRKEFIKDKEFSFEKEELDKFARWDKPLEKRDIDKATAFDKGFADKPGEGKLVEGGKLVDGGKLGEGGRGFSQPGDVSLIRILEARIAAIEATLGQNVAPGGTAAPQPFIGAELRPDLSQGALTGEEDYSGLQQQMKQASAPAKRLYDKSAEH